MYKVVIYLTPYMASKNNARPSDYHNIKKSMPCLASFFDALSGVKKMLNFVLAITCPASANEVSDVDSNYLY